ncbi:MAG: aminotransferase class I/II-fold pyridoxal phosphate-dependent enzyme, partial [Clostridia bacterium]|nr:aminotransferase class I/II-fold pyridoxal phosphate-dependent enzyme [Clostridia bacterium]
MYMFVNDYSEGMHQKILDAIVKTNLEQHTGYGMDEYCEKARLAIKKELKNENSAVHFLVGGTQANTTVICALLRPHQGVISAVSGHINVHESGAIEATGHKVLALPSDDGKITAKQVEDCVKGHFDDPTAEHMVQPKMVYISNPTEVGTIYSKKELEDIKKVCDEHNLILFCDGARLGCALMS